MTDLVVECPRCHEQITIRAFVQAELVTTDSHQYIRLLCSTPNTPHACKEVSDDGAAAD